MPRASAKTLQKKAPPEMTGIVYERSGRWWVASMPAVAGAYSQGRTKAEAYRNLLDALAELIAAYKSQLPTRARRAAASA